MPFKHILLILIVVIVWGVNFLFITLGLKEIPPLLLCALRFLLVSIPAIFFLKMPAMPFRIIALYGLVMFALQFSLLFLGMHIGMPPGMSALIAQAQVFFSMLFAAIILREMPQIWQILGALVAFTGIGLIATHAHGNITLLGFICILAAAATWGAGNLIIKKYHHVNMIGLIAWGSIVACAPMFLLSFIFEGWGSMVVSYHHVTFIGIVSLLYIVYASTWIGYGVWNWLLSRYPIGLITPFTLLVPIVGILSAVLVLGESFELWKLISGLLVISGLCINLFGARIFRACHTMLSTEKKVEPNG